MWQPSCQNSRIVRREKKRIVATKLPKFKGKEEKKKVMKKIKNFGNQVVENESKKKKKKTKGVVLYSKRGKTGGVGQLGLRVKRVMGQNGSIGSWVKSRRVDPYFSNKFFFFFEIDAICQLFINSLIVIRFSLVIL